MTKDDDVWVIISYRKSEYDPESNRLIKASLQNENIPYKVYYKMWFWKCNGQLYYGLTKITKFPKIIIIRQCKKWLRKFLETKKEIIKINDLASRTIIFNKILSHDLLSKHNILQPKYLTWVENADYESIAKELGEKIIIKDAYGSLGAQVFLVDNQNDFDKAIENIKKEHILFQQFIDTYVGTDVRTIVIGNKVVSMYKRVSQSGFKSNLSVNGKVEFMTDPTIEKQAIKVAGILGGRFISVDFLLGKNKEPIFCEANGRPGLTKLLKSTGINLAEHLAAYVKELLNEKCFSSWQQQDV